MAKKRIKVQALEIDNQELGYAQEVELSSENIDTTLFGKETLDEAIDYAQRNPIFSAVQNFTLKRNIVENFTIQNGATTIYRNPTFEENVIIELESNSEMFII